MKWPKHETFVNFFPTPQPPGTLKPSPEQELVLAILGVVLRALYDQMRPHWWQNEIPKENPGENKVTTLTPGVEKCKQFTLSIFYPYFEWFSMIFEWFWTGGSEVQTIYELIF